MGRRRRSRSYLLVVYIYKGGKGCSSFETFCLEILSLLVVSGSSDQTGTAQQQQDGWSLSRLIRFVCWLSNCPTVGQNNTQRDIRLGFLKKFETRTVRETGLSDSLIMLHLSILMDCDRFLVFHFCQIFLIFFVFVCRVVLSYAIRLLPTNCRRARHQLCPSVTGSTRRCRPNIHGRMQLPIQVSSIYFLLFFI